MFKRYPLLNHNRIIYMVTIFFPSHEITITSKIELASTDTHNRIIYMLRIFFPSHEIIIVSSDTHTIESFT